MWKRWRRWKGSGRGSGRVVEEAERVVEGWKRWKGGVIEVTSNSSLQ